MDPSCFGDRRASISHGVSGEQILSKSPGWVDWSKRSWALVPAFLLHWTNHFITPGLTFQDWNKHERIISMSNIFVSFFGDVMFSTELLLHQVFLECLLCASALLDVDRSVTDTQYPLWSQQAGRGGWWYMKNCTRNYFIAILRNTAGENHGGHSLTGDHGKASLKKGHFGCSIWYGAPFIEGKSKPS